ncbi:TetR/AcrR family transcriptional regulator [Allonocardiopsis opalescens]|uniref:TetR family transcriptional regulator n=1 Tax=Allonocardiopsis opalescens TaxID=1144618 RepID=A0A2T0Q4M2_9ACTN|nr:TetR/AcrR family transcriptional regulator [Allonocardiopsis opalescens]PRX98765.1 TetR family transcriptional regulator [Allonocardiopsis opalescens]
MSRNNAGLSHARIVEDALRIVNGQGLRRLTMRRLGDALQVEAMAIYHHFPRGKEQLLDALVHHVMDVPAAADPAAPPDTRLRHWAAGYRDRLLEHSGVLPLLINRGYENPAVLDALYAALTELGLRGAAVVDAARTLDAYVLGAVVNEVRDTASRPEPDAAGEQAPAPPVDPRRHPHLAALAAHRRTRDAADRFAVGLELVLAGVQQPG